MFLLILLVGCETAGDSLTPLSLPTMVPVSENELPLKVVATTNIIGDIVGRVGGSAIELTTLMAPGQDPHSYEPSSGDLAAAADANVIFVNGWDLEEGLVANLGNVNEDGLMVPVSAEITPLEYGILDPDRGTEIDQTTANPHVWLDPHLVVHWVENIVEVLTTLNPANAELYSQNGNEYETELQSLIQYYDAQLGPISADKRVLITNHDSLGYFAAAYDFEVVGTVLPGAGALAEPSANDLAALVEIMNDIGICTIFAESTANIGLAETVKGELSNCESVEIVTLYTDSVGPVGSGAESYIGMMRANVEAIVSAVR